MFAFLWWGGKKNKEIFGQLQCNLWYRRNVQAILGNATIQTVNVTYIFINSFKKVYFILMFDTVCSSKTTVVGKRTTVHWLMWTNTGYSPEIDKKRGTNNNTLKYNLRSEGNVPETKLCFIESDFNIFAVGYIELYKNGVPPVVPLGSCRMPVKTEDNKTSAHVNRCK